MATPIFNGDYQPAAVATLTDLKYLPIRHGIINLLGGDVLRDGAGGLYYWDADSTATGDDFDVVTPVDSPAQGRWLIIAPYGYVRGLSSTVDSSDTLQAALDAARDRATVNDTFEVVRLPAGQVVKLDSYITVDIGRVDFDLNGCRLDCSAQSTTTGVGILLTSSRSTSSTVGYDTFGQMAQGGIRNGTIYGPGVSGTSIAINFDDSSVGGRTKIRDVEITHWGIGERMKVNCYIIKHENCEIYQNVTAIHLAAGATNTGEGITYTNCVLYNNQLVLDARSDSVFWFTNCHLDYNTKIFVNTAGAEMVLRDSWVEYKGEGTGSLSTFPIIDLGDERGKFQMHGGVWWVIWDTATVPTATETILCNHALAEVYIDGVYFHQADVTGEVFISGTCLQAVVINSRSDDWDKMPALSHSSSGREMSRLGDGFFANPTRVVDRWFIQDDAGSTPISRMASTNISSLALDAGNDKIIAVRAGAATSCAFAVAIRVRNPGMPERFGVRLIVEATATPGTMDILTFYANEAGGGQLIDAPTPSAAELDASLTRFEIGNASTSVTHHDDITPAAAGAGAYLVCKPSAIPKASKDYFEVYFVVTNITVGKSIFVRAMEVTAW